MSNRDKRVVMIGTARQTQGGVSSVVNVLAGGGLFRCCPVDYIATHCDGSILAKTIAVLRAWPRFMLCLLRGRVALLHAHTASRASFWRKSLFIGPAILARVPVVLHLHGGEFHVFYEKECSGPTKRFVCWIFERSCRVVVLSESWRDWVRTAFPAASIEVIFNPVVIPERSAHKWRIHQPAPLLFLGRLGQGKGTYDLLKAVALLSQRHVDLRVFFGGDGEIEQVRTEARVLGIEKYVELLGWVCGAEKERLLDEAMIYVLPSYNEGLPMGVLEAMAHGLPVVSTPVGGIPEAVTEGVEGFLVAVGDVAALAQRLQMLLVDPVLRARMGAAARARAEKDFGVDGIVQRWVALYRELGVECECTRGNVTAPDGSI